MLVILFNKKDEKYKYLIDIIYKLYTISQSPIGSLDIMSTITTTTPNAFNTSNTSNTSDAPKYPTDYYDWCSRAIDKTPLDAYEESIISACGSLSCQRAYAFEYGTLFAQMCPVPSKCKLTCAQDCICGGPTEYSIKAASSLYPVSFGDWVLRACDPAPLDDHEEAVISACGVLSYKRWYAISRGTVYAHLRTPNNRCSKNCARDCVCGGPDY